MEDSAGLTALQKEYARIWERMEEMTTRDIISEYTSGQIRQFLKYVLALLEEELFQTQITL